MIEVTILATNYGDRTQQMTVQSFKEKYAEMLGEKRSWAIFAEDTAKPEGASRIGIADVKDGQKLTIVPQMAGG